MKLQGLLNEENTEETASAARQYLERNGIDDNRCLAAYMLLKESMMKCSAGLGDTAAYRLDLRKYPDEIRFILTVPGAKIDAFSSVSEIYVKLAGYADIPAPVWSYVRGRNRVVLTIRRYYTTRTNLKFVWNYLRKYKTGYFSAVAGQWVEVAMNIVVPLLGARIIVAYTNSAVRQIVLTAIAIFAANIAVDVCSYFYNIRLTKIYNRLVSDMESDLIECMLRITDSCMNENGGGFFIRRLTGEVETVAGAPDGISSLLSQALHYAGVLTAMLVICPPAFLVVLILLSGQTIIETVRTGHVAEDDRGHRRLYERFYGFISETVRGASDIKTLNCEDGFKAEALEKMKSANDSRLDMLVRSWKYKFARWMTEDSGKLIFMCLLAWMLKKKLIAPALALVLYNYYQDVGTSAVLFLVSCLSFFERFDVSAERVCEILDNPQYPQDRFGEKRLDTVRGEVRFENVTFRYESFEFDKDNRDVLKSMSFTVPAGSTAALVGRTGCGKTTAFRLLCRLNEINSGCIYLDGTDIRELDKDSLRGNIALVSQNPYLFHMSVRDNLRIVKPDMTEEEMKEACRIACIDEDIEKMPKGYDSVLGESGVTVSGGQRQRLAIARCLLRDTPVMLMDEATSALDNVTQTEIMKGIGRVRRGRTLIMIAHRLSTVVNADRIFFIDDGKIIAEGTHQELMAGCEGYRLLYENEDRE